jgi:hypothetical protein
LEFFSRSMLELQANSIAHVGCNFVYTANGSFSDSLGRASLHVVSRVVKSAIESLATARSFPK